jgi:hypothetical protein
VRRLAAAVGSTCVRSVVVRGAGVDELSDAWRGFWGYEFDVVGANERKPEGRRSEVEEDILHGETIVSLFSRCSWDQVDG